MNYLFKVKFTKMIRRKEWDGRWEGGLRERGYMYPYSWLTLLYSRNQHNIIKQLWKFWSLSHVRLCDPKDCSPTSSSVHGILQARILEWVGISFSRWSSQPRDWTQVSCTVGRCFTVWATREQNERPITVQEVWNCRANRAANIFPPKISSLGSHIGQCFPS